MLRHLAYVVPLVEDLERSLALYLEKHEMAGGEPEVRPPGALATAGAGGEGREWTVHGASEQLISETRMGTSDRAYPEPYKEV